MATADTMAFATPLKHHSNTLFTMSSSPGLPSPSELFQKTPVLRTGSRAVPIPTTANATFMSASSLLKGPTKKDKSAESIRNFKAPPNFDDILVEDAKPKARKSRAKKAAGDDEAQVKKPARARVKKTTLTVEDNTMVKEKAVRKPRAKKAEDETQPKLPKARVTKSSSGSGAAKKSEKALDSSLHMEKENRAPIKIPSEPILLENHTEARPLSKKPEKSAVTNFSGLLGNFGYKDGEESQEQETPKQATLEVSGTRKRKSPEISKEDSTIAKPKAIRKKAKTITDQATAAYVVDVTDEGADISKRPGAITEFFQYQPKDSDAGQITSNGFNVPKISPNLNLKIPSKSSKLKAGDRGLPILLSPESAIKQHKQQDIVFGTSSQLADPENSPSFIRDVQEALRASNEIDDQFFPDSSNDSCTSASISQRIRLRAGRSNLWAASARDEYGELLNVEVIDLSTTPVAKVKSASVHLSTDETTAKMTTETSSKSRDHEIVTASTLDTPNFQGITKSSVISNIIDPLDVVMKDTTTPDPAKAQRSKTSTRKSKAKKIAPVEKPDYTTYTTAQLTKAVTSFGFKTVKKRETMITLLNKCWESKHGAKSTDEVDPCEGSRIPKPVGELVSTAVNAKPASPKKSRGRPKTAGVAPTLPAPEIAMSHVTTETNKLDSDSEDIPLSLRKTKRKSKRKSKDISDEISDSEPPLTPSPPRRKTTQKKAHILPLKLVDDVDALHTSALLSKTELFAHITKAIKSIPPSTSSSQPNWHEKMLLYDPIILEDLTVWLNTGGLQSVGWDGEVCPSEVKSWCESKSVCCLWRENLRGGARSRY